MIQLTGFSRSFDIEDVLYNNNMIWLSKQVNLPSKKFEGIAKGLELRQEDWSTFWKKLRGEKKSKLTTK